MPTSRPPSSLPPAVAVMAKVPGASAVKSRLHSVLTAARATELYRCFLLDRLDALAELDGVSLVVAFNQYAFAFGPALLGVLRDATGGYTVPLALCMLLEGMAAIVVLIRPSANRGAPRLRRGATSVGV